MTSPQTFDDILAEFSRLRREQRELETELEAAGYRSRNLSTFERDILKTDLTEYNRAVNRLVAVINNVLNSELNPQLRNKLYPYTPRKTLDDFEDWVNNYYLVYGPQLLRQDL